MTTRQIDPGLGLAMAGQVSIGLTPGDGQEQRATAALIAIGLMLRNADGGDLVQQALDLAGQTRIEAIDGGGWRIYLVGDAPDPGPLTVE